ncbi:hypothetical protein AA0113_g10552 [Alternaria arborescens]|uniref:Secreted protein n=3 Tax=Alternaria sect. Alternaria TaxID=2499237 RepID=A0A4Q4NH14_ALTAL|nr:hypothetical protein AA0111_g10650 [Alternaria arborescens]RYN18918.1 hypothetical protein AA0115_g11074 [Alternaria tenuissima]RYN76016.1 hypothetical protein AA0117_g6001 [Alternaria alternata]RYN20271.1 hypothetical protein AA0112_g10720 [Alternaria arborescens]RYN50135.1 hypothetical protein AA0118_g11047 [Alternaria tenuissima]RYN50250.1 hypothetical protein AA0114_g6064 [Alternaria tenuissima]
MLTATFLIALLANFQVQLPKMLPVYSMPTPTKCFAAGTSDSLHIPVHKIFCPPLLHLIAVEFAIMSCKRCIALVGEVWCKP